MYCNPHSINPIGIKSEEKIEQIRQEILQFFNAPYRKYSVVFTSGCTDSLKKVGEWFPWSENSKFYYSLESHNSLLGIRELACDRGATFQTISPLYFKNSPQFTDIINIIKENSSSSSGDSWDLFSFPGQCNYSGTKYPLELINVIHKQCPRVKVLLDAASLVGTSPLDLSKYNPDFVALSFYKMFGYPTGLGALLIRHEDDGQNVDQQTILKKSYFSGGTVNVSLSQERFHVPRDHLVKRFEDGTVSFLSILALHHGFSMLNQLGGMKRIQQHTFSLIQYLKEELLKLKHSNGVPLVLIYTDNHYKDSEKQGAILNFNLIRSNSIPIGYNEVEKIASLHNIYFRTGCFCNPGACHGYLNLTLDDIKEHLAEGHVCWDDKDIVNGKLTGSIRVSLGYMSTFEDIYRLLEFLKDSFLDDQLTESESNLVSPSNTNEVELSEMYIYPVKSCGPFRVYDWEIVSSGLRYDREWTIVDQTGTYLNQKKLPLLAQIETEIDLDRSLLVLKAAEMNPAYIPLDYYPVTGFDKIQVCGDKVDGLLYGKDDVKALGGLDVSEWLYHFTGKHCHLVRKAIDSHRQSKIQDQSSLSTVETNQISFANESPFLLISLSSLNDLKSKIHKEHPETDPSEWNWITKHSFRANFIVNGGTPYNEDQWEEFQLSDGDCKLQFKTIGCCNRCKMICINQKMGIEEKEPLATLATYRRNKGKIIFGQHLQLQRQDEMKDPQQKQPIMIHCPSRIKILTLK
eukprot:gene1270-1599_t